MVSNWAFDCRWGVGVWLLDFEFPKGSWKEFPEKFLNRMKTSNTQHPTSNNQWFPIGPLIGGWVLDVGCWMFPRVHGEGVEGGEGQSISSRNNASTPGSRWRLAVVETILRPSPPSTPL